MTWDLPPAKSPSFSHGPSPGADRGTDTQERVDERTAESETRRRRAEALAEVARAGAASLDPEVAARRIVGSILRLFGGTAATLYRLEPGSAALVPLAAAGDLGPAADLSGRLANGTGVVGVAVRDRRPVVSDDVLVESYGYRVLVAGLPDEALRIAEGHPGPIHVLLTDVVMPRMSGRDLAERLLPRRPEMKVVYMSGYTDDATIRLGTLDGRAPFLEKPFTPSALAGKIREILGRTPSPV